ncbi:neurotransmitter:Na+ symporter, NSS family [Maridesulfovibrio ferrireducens]|uniref:Neurotransmitter:Na+ symporter, NSS family n=1 Tax=Maridesulfovibrio ferrireducens TaxID=246191 RepID=A0A1G9KBF7_9BACT|nr:sodium-dependent transporter [Maridesulfovibrio ferrireducens]SDL46939.1 neurotransmitter:Na+ symporter, NSS family [Maridesulfovibrio ferrireducens]
MSDKHHKAGHSVRDAFTSNLGMLAATLGSAVGLGNIWKFPSMTGTNGGASFLFVYLACTVVVGLPVMISEIMLGRTVKANAITTLRKLSPKGQPWGIVGISGVVAAFLILCFYTEVAGWVFAYIFKGISGSILTTDPTIASAAFADLISDPVQSIGWQWFVIIFVSIIITFGISKGIEKVTIKLMPILFLLLLVICGRSLTLPGAEKGLEFLFAPDFSKISGSVILMAMGLAFFKLSIGMGTMMTYGSYFKNSQNIPLTATRVVLADLLISLLAGIAIFPAVFAYGFDVSAGPSLLFITIPAVFASMPMGHLFAVLFFVLTAVAATGAMLSLFEVPVAYLCEARQMSRKAATLTTALLIMLLGAPAALSSSLTKDVKVFGMNFFDLFDFLSSNLCMPAGGLLICIFTGWVFGKDRFKAELSNHGLIKNEKVVDVLFFLIKYVSPLLVAIVMMNMLKVF